LIAAGHQQTQLRIAATHAGGVGKTRRGQAAHQLSQLGAGTGGSRTAISRVQQSRRHQHRQMGDQGHRLIVLGCITADAAGPQGHRQSVHGSQRLGLAASSGREHPGAPSKQTGQPGLDPGTGGAGHRMAGHKARVQGLPALQHRRLDRPDIGDHRCRGQGCHQRRIWCQQLIQRQSQHHQAAPGKHTGIGGNPIDQTALQGPLGALLAMGHTMDNHPLPAQIEGDRASDQAQTDDAHGRGAPGIGGGTSLRGHQRCGANRALIPASYDSAMLEAHAHQQLKALLRQEASALWPHHLSLSRLVGRSLRRGDHSLIRLAVGSDPSWWIGLLVPMALSETPLALVVTDSQRQRLLQVELPRLARAGIPLACAEGPQPPAAGVLWLLNHAELIEAWRQQQLAERQLVLPHAERLEELLRAALAVTVEPHHWDQLRRNIPSAEASLLELHERLNRTVLAAPRHPGGRIALGDHDEAPLRQLLALLGPLPRPWERWLSAQGQGWCSWAELNPALLQWTLQRQPLDPLEALAGLLKNRGAIVIGQLPAQRAAEPLPTAALQMGLNPQVDVRLGEPPLADPLPLYAPLRQPLPNSPIYGEHLLQQSRRLMLAQERLSVVLVDDELLRHQLTSGLAGEFGSRVVHESTAVESNAVLCARWSWWLEQQERLPLPSQLVVALLPIASLEDPLTAARVAQLRQLGRDWFRELLLPDALLQLQHAAASLRNQGGQAGTRMAILDGRLRGRSWGQRVLQSLEPWVNLSRLLPN